MNNDLANILKTQAFRPWKAQAQGECITLTLDNTDASNDAVAAMRVLDELFALAGKFNLEMSTWHDHCKLQEVVVVRKRRNVHVAEIEG